MFKWFQRINRRLIALFLVVAIIPIIAVGVSNTISTQRIFDEEVEERQVEVTRLTAYQIREFVNEIVTDLESIGHVTYQYPQDDYAILQELVENDPFFDTVQVINADGQELARYENNQLTSPNQLTNVSAHEIFFRPMRGEKFFSSVRLNSAGEPVIQMSVPVYTADSDRVNAVVAAQINLRAPWQIIQDQQIGDNGYILLLDKRGNIIVYPQDGIRTTTSFTNTDLMQAVLAEPDEIQVLKYKTPLGQQEEVIGSAIRIEGPEWFLVAERPSREAYSATLLSQRNAYLGIGLSLLLTIPLAIILSRQITRPLVKLSESAREIINGNMNVQTDIQRQDEIGQLSRAFNQMTSQLRSLIQTLEERIANRTRDLQVAADVSRQVTTVLQPDELLPHVVELTKTGFDLHSVEVYLYKENTLSRVATTSTGSDSSAIFELSFGEPNSLIKCANERATVYIPDITTSPQHIRESLPGTRSKLVLPLIFATRLIGVLSLEASQVNRFREDDIRVLTSLAEQLSIALRNAQLYAAQVSLTENLKAVDRMKSQFMASVSHELRTPLNAIINFTEFVVAGVYGEINEEQADALNKSLESAEHLLSLISDVLDITKIEAGMMNLYLEDNLNMGAEIAAIVTSTQPLLGDKPIDLETKISQDLPPIIGDRRRVRQILLNLLSNAIKFTERGKISIHAEVQDNNIVVSISDTGPGIALEDHTSIFEAFRQARAGLEHGSGTGLGLAISKRLTEQHNGNLWFETEVGKGTTFFLALPINSSELKNALRQQVGAMT